MLCITINIVYSYISTFQSMCTVANMGVVFSKYVVQVFSE